MAKSQKNWIDLSKDQSEPRLLMNAHASLRDFLALRKVVEPTDYCHRPTVVRNPTDTLDKAPGIHASHREQHLSHFETIILLWSPETKRMIIRSNML